MRLLAFRKRLIIKVYIRKENAMPPKPSGEIKTRIVHNKRKNGNIYVLERQIIYDPEKKRNVVLSSRLISKIVKGKDIPVETRPKRKKGEKIENSNTLSASRKHVGMMDIIDHTRPCFRD